MLYALEVLLDVLLYDPCKGLPTTGGGAKLASGTSWAHRESTF